jgi:putative membrane protein
MNTRQPTFPSYNTTRKKPRRWPLALRFVKGAVHADIVVAVILHAAFTAAICYWQVERNGHLSIPSSVVPSLSIVVGLMLVFRA